jgi:HAD superfamily 5'-nucleotidase-like hydrolase
MDRMKVFVNRILNMKKIKLIGLDMDHTLIRYHSEHFEALVYDLVKAQLIKTHHYPEAIMALKFNFHDAIRGLVIDRKNGNILKLSRYGAIRLSYHGTKAISFAEQKAIYRSIYVDLSDDNYMVIDTSFSIAFCVLYGQLVDLKEELPDQLPSYSTIAQDVQLCVDRSHSDGSLKEIIRNDFNKYVIREPEVVEGLRHFIQHGKKIFILTNSEYDYAKSLLEYAIAPFMHQDEQWSDLFEFVITLSNKPRFFYDNLRFLSINPDDGSMQNIPGPITPGIYQGGNAKKFADDLGLNGDEILYIGDHIYGDILRLKKDCNWRTALVVEELGEEIAAQLNALPIERMIIDGMMVKKEREQEYVTLCTRRIDEESSAYDEEIHQLQEEIVKLDRQITTLLQDESQFYNSRWGRVFRAGAEESYFAYQVERFACVYMEKISDLLGYSPMTYFRANKRSLPHDVG